MIGPILSALSSVKPSVVKKEGPNIKVSIPADHPKADTLRRLFIKYQSAAKINGAEVHYSKQSPKEAEQEVLDILRELLDPEAFDRVLEEIEHYNAEQRRKTNPLAGVDMGSVGAMLGPLVGGDAVERAMRVVRDTTEER